MSGKIIDVHNVESIAYSHHVTDQVLKHKHENFEIVYYLDGKGLSTVYGETIYNFNYIADSLLIIPPEVYHGEYAKEETKIICNQLSLPIECIGKALFYKKTAKNADIFEKIKSQMIQINSLWFEMYTKKIDHAVKINELILHLSINVFNLITRGKKNRSEYKAEITSVVKDYIRRYALKKINYDILAEEFGYSSDRFRHIFVEGTGMTLYAYQQGLRFDYAKRELLLTDTKILDIAQKCGYSNSIRFCEWFSNMSGMSPRKYRSMNENFEWGVVLNSNDVKRRNRVSVLLDIDSASGDGGVSLALAYVMHKKEYVDLLGATVIGDEADEGREQKNFTAFYKAEGVQIGNGTKEAIDLFKKQLSAAGQRVTMVFTGRLTNLAALLSDKEGRKLVREKVNCILVCIDHLCEEGSAPKKPVAGAARDFNSLKSVFSEKDLPVGILDASAPILINFSEIIEENKHNPFFSMLDGNGISNCNVMDMVSLMYGVFGNGGMFTYHENLDVNVSDDGTIRYAYGGKYAYLKINTPLKLRNQIYAAVLKICNALNG